MRKQIHDKGLYDAAIRPYRAGTISAETIADFLLSRLRPVSHARKLYVYDYGGLYGHLAQRVDDKDCIVFALYRKKSGETQLKFKRRKEVFSTAQRPVFLTAPEVWAHMNGCKGHLPPDAYAEWMASLQNAAGVYMYLGLRYWAPSMPSRHSVKHRKYWLSKGKEVASRLGKRFTRKSWTLMSTIHEFFLMRWATKAVESGRGLPFAIRASDGYLGKRFETTRDSARRAVIDLEKAGFIQAAIAEPTSKGQPLYWYIPGTGEPAAESTRQRQIEPRETHARFRRFLRACTNSWQERREDQLWRLERELQSDG
jgi:hypothetical protein